MKFCPECGEDLRGSTKFCPECGFNMASLIAQDAEKKIAASDIQEESVFDEDILQEPPPEKTTRALGTNLEDTVEKILQDRGFSTETRTKFRGTSGQLNEIDIRATKNRVIIAVECKNYAESSKVGIKEIRDFSAKMDDLDIKNGLFVTSSDFSQDAIGWAKNNPQQRQIELWNGSKLTENFQAVVLGRSGGQLAKVSDCLNPRNSIESYSQIMLRNKANVRIARRDLVFHPYYIIQFTLQEQLKTPDRQIHPMFNSGKYVADGLTGNVLYGSDDDDDVFHDESPETKQIVEDLMSIDPRKTVEIQKIENSNVVVHKASTSNRDVEFTVRTKIVEDNMDTIPYSVRKSRDEEVEKEFTYMPSHNAIKLQSKVVYVPKLEIVFESKEYNYTRRILPASDITLTDEISECRHMLRKKHTFAVCEECGIAKCENDIFVDGQNLCYCKDHAPQELRESKKKGSIRGKLGFSFRKSK